MASTEHAYDTPASRGRIDNEEFFPTPSARPRDPRQRHRVPGDEFFVAPRPAEEPGFAARAAARPLRFGFILFAVGWTGILLQLGFLRQLVVGAPVFEEFAKLGPALVIVALLGAQRQWARLPWAWLSGASFGVFEHYSTYPDEPLPILVGRVAFHAGATGLSMALFTVIERLPDVRGRWIATMPATVLHWVNNFGALVFAFLTVLWAGAYYIAEGLSIVVTVLTFVLTLATVAEQEASRRRFESLAQVLLPRLFERQPLAVGLTPDATEEMAAPSSDRPAAPAEPEASAALEASEASTPRSTSTDAAGADAAGRSEEPEEPR